MFLPPPVIIALDYSPATAWTSYVTPKATWKVDALPVVVGFAGAAPPGISLDPVALLKVAESTWTEPSCTLVSMTAVASITTLGAEAEDGKNDVLVHTTSWDPPLTVGAAGQTVIYVRGGAIVEADIHLNAKDYTFALGDQPGKIDLQSVLTHELGHLVGIGHTDVARATMNASLPSGIAARSLERDDREAICALYPSAAGKTDFGCVKWGCPVPWTCVGTLCQRAGEPGVSGGPCATSARPCEGAGDAAECVATSAGPICAVPCEREASAPCGQGMVCVDAADGTYCLPAGATPSPDAGPIPSDAGGDAAALPGPTNEAGCSCATRGGRRASGPFWALLLAWALVRRSRSAQVSGGP